MQMPAKFDSVRFALISAMLASLAACGGGGDGSSPAPAPAPPPAPAPAPAPVPAPAPASTKGLPFASNGYVTLLAGTLSTDPAVACGRVDASQGDQSRFGYRTNAMVLGPDGSIYLTDEPCDLSTGAYAVRKIEPSGRVSTVASGMAPIQQNYAAPLTSFVVANGLAVDQNHNVFVSDARGVHNSLQDRTICHASGMGLVPLTFQSGQGPGIWKISPDGTRSVFAGVAIGAPGPADGQGQGAAFTWPGSLAFSADGTLFALDDGSVQRLRKITPDGAVTSVTDYGYYPTLASALDGSVYAVGDCFPTGNNGSFPLINLTTGEKASSALAASALLAVDHLGNAYSARRTQDDAITTIVRRRKGSDQYESAVYGVRDLRAMTVGANGDLYVKSGYAVLKISFEPDPEGTAPVVRSGLLTHYAGSTDRDAAVACGRVDSSQRLQSKFGLMTNSMVAGADGALYLTDAPCGASDATYAIRKIEAAGAVTTVAKSNPRGSILPGNFSFPSSIAVDGQNNIYVSDYLENYGTTLTDRICSNGEWGVGLPVFDSNVWKVSPEGQLSAFVTGLRNPGPLGFAGDGLLYVSYGLGQSLSVFNAQGEAQTPPEVSASFYLNLVSSFSGEIYATGACTRLDASTTLVDVRSQQVVANDVPNARLVAVDSNGNIYSASPEPIDMTSSWSTVYRRAANSQAFETVATHVQNLQAMAIGPANELYLKSGYAIYRVDFN